MNEDADTFEDDDALDDTEDDTDDVEEDPFAALDAAVDDEDDAIDDGAVEAEKLAVVAYFHALGAEREAHPPDLAHFRHPATLGLMGELTRMHARGWAPARAFVEFAPIADLGPVEHRAWLRAALPIMAPRLGAALAALAKVASPRVERELARANREIVKGRRW